MMDKYFNVQNTQKEAKMLKDGDDEGGDSSLSSVIPVLRKASNYD